MPYKYRGVTSRIDSKTAVIRNHGGTFSAHYTGMFIAAFGLVAMYLVAATMLWIVADQSAPAGSGVSFKRVLCAVAIIVPFSYLIGSFHILHLGVVIEFSLDFLVVLILIRMSFWRTFFATSAYYGTLLLAALGLELLYGK